MYIRSKETYKISAKVPSIAANFDLLFSVFKDTHIEAVQVQVISSVKIKGKTVRNKTYESTTQFSNNS